MNLSKDLSKDLSNDLSNVEIYKIFKNSKLAVVKFFFNFQRIFYWLNVLTKIFTLFCRSRRADSKYIYFVGHHKLFFTIII